ncbi:hypothetical protein ALI144C_13880 [Actinosynnema sp. ALI-1.44]|uniref:hypothetical protein n=1 Tax=Actinosynnema sp. ALI-1.44 TaxID=1933779 RepID=UPI00097BBECB|nr:hypothetical protein [Actinosynnema sp. ALI-1.44]ONI85368.1 hypothetical protein ALI144C_13880 [Actinosynnema sp. ALI-1.44]
MRALTQQLPLADHGFIGDGHSWALVGRDGSINRMFVSQEERGLVFDEHHRFVVTVDDLRDSRQYYLPDTNVLVTEMHSTSGVVEVTDAFTSRPPADRVGDVPAPRGELLRYVRVLSGHVTLCLSIQPIGTTLHLVTDRPPRPALSVQADEDLWFLLHWGNSPSPMSPRRVLDDTATAWRRWTEAITYQGPHAATVHRSALALTGIGRFKPVDAALAASAFRTVGLVDEADQVLRRALDIVDVGASHRWPGQFLDCAHQWASNGGAVDDTLWDRLTDAAHRLPPSRSTYITAMHQVALDRLALLSRHLGVSGQRDWRTKAATLRDRILCEAWDESRQSLTSRLPANGELDPRLLALPSHRVLPAGHPRMAATAHAIAAELSSEPGLVFDPGQEERGAVLRYGFLLVENLSGQHRLDEAEALYEALTTKSNPMGLFGERLGDGQFLGRFPDPATHTVAIASAVALADVTR